MCAFIPKWWAWIAGLCLAAQGAFAQTDTIYSEVDVPPLFQGCDDPLISAEQRLACSLERISGFIGQNIQYPDSAKAHQTEGVVLVRFAVDTSGEVLFAELLRDVGDGCGQEALRMVRLFPRFAPAQKNGQVVAAYMNLPIRFRGMPSAESQQEAMFQLHWGTLYANQLTAAELQGLLAEPIVVRDYYGNLYKIRDIELNYIHKNKIKSQRNYSDRLNPASRKLLEKAKAGAVVVLIARVERNYELLEVARELEIR